MVKWNKLIVGDHRAPGEQLVDLFKESDVTAVEWARGLLDRKNIDPVRNPMTAIKAVRESKPELSLKSAKYLVAELTPDK